MVWSSDDKEEFSREGEWASRGDTCGARRC